MDGSLERGYFFRENFIPLRLRNLCFYPLLLHLGASTKQTFQECNLYKTRSTTILLGSAHSTFNPCNSLYNTYDLSRLRPTYLPIIFSNQDFKMWWNQEPINQRGCWIVCNHDIYNASPCLVWHEVANLRGHEMTRLRLIWIWIIIYHFIISLLTGYRSTDQLNLL